MKKNSTLTIALCIIFITAVTLCIILLGGCRKQTGNQEDTYTSLTDFFQKNQTALQHFSFTNSAGAIIRMEKDTKIHFPPNAFTDQYNVVINGQVDIDVKQLLTPADIILNDMPTMSNLAPLESGGEFFIGATANGAALRLAAGKKIQVELPVLGISMDNMKVYNGYAWPNDSIPANGSPYNWTANTTNGNVIRFDSLKVYDLFCDSTKWINCDRLLGGTPVNYHVLLGNCPSAAGTRVFVHFTGRNSVIALWPDGNKSYFTGSLIAAPVTIVGICITDGWLWASVTTASLQDGGSTTMHFSQTNSETLKATLSALK